jgi:hypothetical protein
MFDGVSLMLIDLECSCFSASMVALLASFMDLLPIGSSSPELSPSSLCLSLPLSPSSPCT